jgi:hypothetical protein
MLMVGVRPCGPVKMGRARFGSAISGQSNKIHKAATKSVLFSRPAIVLSVTAPHVVLMGELWLARELLCFINPYVTLNSRRVTPVITAQFLGSHQGPIADGRCRALYG